MEKRGQYTAGGQVNLKPSPQDGDNDMIEIKQGAKLNKVDAAAILCTTISMMQRAGWVVQIGCVDDRAYLVISGAKWNDTPMGYLLVEGDK